MKLGPTQTKWLKDLETYPERQTHCQLGFKDNDGNIRACCLGQGLLTVQEMEGDLSFLNAKSGSTLVDKSTDVYEKCETHTCLLQYSYPKLGLNSASGQFSVPYKNCRSLADMNDGGFSWAEIAAYIREHPENVLSHSV